MTHPQSAAVGTSGVAPRRGPAYVQTMSKTETGAQDAPTDAPEKPPEAPKLPKEIGGPPGPEPTRYGDWQYKGRVTDF